MPKQLELFTSEWGVRNDVAHLIDPLNELLPMFGMVKNANKNKALEKFRKAQGVAYDAQSITIEPYSRITMGDDSSIVSNSTYYTGSW